MSATTVAARARDFDERVPFATLRDIWAVTQRNLIHFLRIPQLLVFSTIQPVIFVLLWRYVFGGSVVIPGPIPYVDYLMPGIFVQTVVFGAIATAIGLAADVKGGLLERFLSLPMSRSAVLFGRTTADLVRNIFVVILMVLVGFLVGFRVHTNVFEFLAGIAIVALFGYAMSWLFAVVGLLVKDPETAQAAAFPVLAPLVFASSAFVLVDRMAGWLQPFARNQPVSETVSAVRYLVVGGNIPGGPTSADVFKALIWCAAIVAICAPIAVRLYRRAV
jgi:ABC-2 type transport system permease protein/oleandomycin transport system permease protein